MTEYLQFLEKHWLLSLAAILLIFAIIIVELLDQRKKPKSISPAGAVDKINHEDAVVIDIRDPTQFEKGHILNSLSSNRDQFHQGHMDKYKTTPLIIVCQQGLDSQKLVKDLEERGFIQAFALQSGIQGWLDANLPLAKGKANA
jgi:rhodanese-related sulfurtransferase